MQKRVFADKSYETGIDLIENHWIGPNFPSAVGSLVFQVEYARAQRDTFAANTQLIVQPQIQGVMRIDGTNYFTDMGVREPLNEEILAQAMLSIAHGADGICWFIFHSTPTNFYKHASEEYSILGLQNHDAPNYTHRHRNIYGQDKWNAVGEMNLKIESWKPTLDKINWQSGWSVHKDGPSHNFVSDIQSIKRNSSNLYDDSPPCVNCDETDKRYWEIGFFNPIDQNDLSKYFIMVNRRCVPDINNQGDFRLLKVKFDSTNLPGFRNWKIIDVEDDSIVITFDRNSTGYFSLGEFEPGEGKLYKLAPIMQEGGILVTNEKVENVNVICHADVNNNGKNISILDGTEIQFKTGAAIKMQGGDFICANNSTSSTNDIILKGYNYQTWNGISLKNTSGDTRIEKTRFENCINPITIDNNNAATFYNPKIIRKNSFDITNAGSIALKIFNQFNLLVDSNFFDISNFTSTVALYYKNNLNLGPEAAAEPEDPVYYNINITNNKFDGGFLPVMMQDLGSNYTNFYLYNNTFENTGLYGIAGLKIFGKIKQNRFIDPSENFCIYLTQSTPQMYGNVLKSEKRNMVLNQSFPRLSPYRSDNQLIWEGGKNYFEITTSTDTSENILFNHSNAEINLGKNTFKITNEYSYHLYGTMNTNNLGSPYQAVKNCWNNDEYPKIFLYSELDTPIVPYSFTYLPTSCIPATYIDESVTDQGYNINDTTFISTYDSTDILPDDEALLNQIYISEELANYPEMITHSKGLIDNYPESFFIYDALYQMYVAYSGLDTSANQNTTDVLFSDLKQYLETKILSENYPEDFDDMANDLILMCNIKLDEYDDAQTGYEFIALYHPDAEKRMIASWEYANIDDLLEGMGGGRKGGNAQMVIDESSLENHVTERMNRINELADKDPIMRRLKETYIRRTEEKKKPQTRNEQPVRSIKLDETKINDRVNRNLYLKQEDVSEAEKDKLLFEDINLILNPENVEFGKDLKNANVPTEYSLSQNYPNPFNPVTKIAFDLPEDGQVKLTIYDMLGREITKLINNEMKMAGKYEVEFNGVNMSSGVYFYRLEVNKFVHTKRMVLIK